MRLEFETPDGRTTYAPPEETFFDSDGNQYVFMRTHPEGNVRKAYLNGAE
jgi:hypothetical protein